MRVKKFNYKNFLMINFSSTTSQLHYQQQNILLLQLQNVQQNREEGLGLQRFALIVRQFVQNYHFHRLTGLYHISYSIPLKIKFEMLF